MTPEFPHDIPIDFEIIDATTHIDTPVECSMLRLEKQCCNDAHTIVLYPLNNGRYGVVAICDMCAREWTDYDHWRKLAQLERETAQ
jgi:hypothetical protein